MLDELSVSNLGIIESARISFGPGMAVVTGETGAGKTLLLGALRLLTGAPARAGLIGPHGDDTVVEARFLLDEGEAVVSRRVHPRGSRSYIDGRMAPARALAALLEGYVEIVGQHDSLFLTRPGALRDLIDLRLRSPGLLSGYREAWEMARALESSSVAGGDLRSLERELDLLEYQTNEIDRAGFRVGEDGELERLAVRLGNAERIGALLAETRGSLAAARDRIGPAVGALRQVCDLDPSRRDLLDMMEGLDALAAEVSSATREAWEDTEADPEALTAVNERLSLLGDLRRKYGAGIKEILAFRDGALARRLEVAGMLERVATLEADRRVARRRLEEAGRALREARREAAVLIVEGAVAHLCELGFSDPVIDIEIGAAEPRPAGADIPELAFASDSRLEPGPVGKVASGGELSRLVLSLRLAAGAGAARVVAFDEIDAGVGGSTALAMGAKLARVSGRRQTLCVSHLPQVAAYADTHIVVERNGPVATVRTLDEGERLRELARMLSGLSDSERGHRHAGELRTVAQARRLHEMPATDPPPHSV